MGRAFYLAVLAAAAIAVPDGAGLAAEKLRGQLYMVGSHDSERIERVEFQYNGQQFKVASPRRTHDLTGSGDVNALLNSLRSRENGTSQRRIRRVATDSAGTFSVPKAAPGPVLRIELEDWENVPEPPAAAELPEMGGTLSGDDRSLTHVALEADGSAYYLGEDAKDGATFGEIDLATNTTTRLLAGLPAAADVAGDPHRGELIVIGAGEIAQIQPRPVARIVSRHEVPPGEALESGAVDGDGHLFVRRTDGEILFVDYSASGRIGAAENFTAAARVAKNAGEAPSDSERAGALTWLEILIVLAAILVLSSAFLAVRLRHIGRTRGDKLNRANGAGEGLVYARWPEDWSELKRLIDSMSEAERLKLGGQIECTPDWLDDAQALIRRPVRGALSELRGGAAFGAALAGFARGEDHCDWSGADADGLVVSIRHQRMSAANADWSRVIVEASVNETLGMVAAGEDETVVDAGPVATKKERRKRKKPRRRLGDIAADVGFFDIRWMFDGVARRLVADGTATRLDLDAAEGLRMPGDAETAGGVLEDVLRATLASERRDGAPPPSLAVLAYEDKGKIQFIALRSGAAADDDRPANLTGAALKEAHDAATRSGGRAWVEPGEAGQICRFTLAGKAPKPPRRKAKKRAGWRPAQPKAVWSMRSHGDASRF